MDKKDALNMFADFVKGFNDVVEDLLNEHEIDPENESILRSNIETIDNQLNKFIQDNDLEK